MWKYIFLMILLKVLLGFDSASVWYFLAEHAGNSIFASSFLFFTLDNHNIFLTYNLLQQILQEQLFHLYITYFQKTASGNLEKFFPCGLNFGLKKQTLSQKFPSLTKVLI